MPALPTMLNLMMMEHHGLPLPLLLLLLLQVAVGIQVEHTRQLRMLLLHHLLLALCANAVPTQAWDVGRAL